MISQLQPGEVGWQYLEPMLRTRAETVKFGLKIDYLWEEKGDHDDA